MVSATLLALCVQVADLSSLYLSFDDAGAARMEELDEAELRWFDQLRAAVETDEAVVIAMHDGFIEAMALRGDAFAAQVETCMTEIDSRGSGSTGGKG